MGTWLRTIADRLGFTNAQQTGGDTAKADTAKKAVKTAVLVIDDDAHFLATIRDSLKEHGFETYTAACGATGLNILANAPDNLRVLLLDYKMPQFDGADTMRYVHQVRRNIKVIGVTAVPFDQLPEGFRNGVDKIISKPFRTEELIAAIKEAASQQAQPALNAPASAPP